MKKFLILAIIAIVAAAGCEKPKRFDPKAAQVYINSKKEVTKGYAERLSNLEVIKQADGLHSTKGELGLADFNKDLTNIRIVGEAGWVVGTSGPGEGLLTEEFLCGRNVILIIRNPKTLLPSDTIAYIPNSIMITMEQQIRAAYTAGNWEECYRLFREGYVFTPITAAEYRALKAAGNN